MKGIFNISFSPEEYATTYFGKKDLRKSLLPLLPPSKSTTKAPREDDSGKKTVSLGASPSFLEILINPQIRNL